MFSRSALLGCIVAVASLGAQAAPLSYWQDNGYKVFADDEGVERNGYVNPGWGGQAFDAEYLFYKYSKADNTLSIGLQTGYDIVDGHHYTGGKNYYAGDLALSFSKRPGVEFAVDFGLLTKDYNGEDLVDAGTGTGVDAAGVYQVSSWNNDIYFSESAPFAMNGGTKVADLVENVAGYDSAAKSYFRTVTFDYSELGFVEGFDFSAHWTMSCGNDVVAGTAHVPNPGSLPLMLLGLFAGAYVYRKK